MSGDLQNPIFHDEDKAREYLEQVRWPNGPYCPHCGETENVKRLEGKSHRPGLHYCRSCRGHFSVTVGTLFERSKIPLHKWLMAFHLLTSSKKGMSTHQLHRMLGVTYKSAWFMTHRIREAMKDGNPDPLGGKGKSVQADETYFGKKATREVSPQRKGRPYTKSGKAGPAGKRAVFALVSDGKARTFHIKHATAQTVRQKLVQNVTRDTELHTDESRLYIKVGSEYAAHRTVNHSSGEYVSKDGVTTNNVENYFSIFKRGMKGVYQHCSEKHLHRYLAEFDFRYNNRTGHNVSDAERREKALKGITGKRLTYRRTNLGTHLAA